MWHFFINVSNVANPKQTGIKATTAHYQEQ
jgi:hypothetical protein